MVHYKLSYFPLYGRAEPIRWLFKLAEVDFEDDRVAREDWPALKDKTPYGQMPVLEVDGVQLAQAGAIIRYLGRLFGFAGESPMEEAQVDSVSTQLTDMMMEMKQFLWVAAGHAAGDKEQLHHEVFVPARDKHFAILTKILKKNGSGFLVGPTVTYADIGAVCCLSMIRALCCEHHQKTFYEGFPEVEALVEKVQAIPQIKQHLETRFAAPY